MLRAKQAWPRVSPRRNHKFHAEFFMGEETYGTPSVAVAIRSMRQRRQTNTRTDRQTDGQHHRVKPRFAAGA